MLKPFIKPILTSSIHNIKKVKLLEKSDLKFMYFDDLMQNIKEIEKVYVCNKKKFSFVVVPLICLYHKIELFEIENEQEKNGFFVQIKRE